MIFDSNCNDNDSSLYFNDDESFVLTKMKESIAYLNGKVDAQAAMLSNQAAMLTNQNTTFAMLQACTNKDNLRLIAQVKVLQQDQDKLKDSIVKLDTESLLTKKFYDEKKEQEVENSLYYCREEIKNLEHQNANFIEESSTLTKVNSNLQKYVNKLEEDIAEKDNSNNGLKSNEKCDRLIKDNDKLTLVISEKDQEIVKSRNFWYMEGIQKGKDNSNNGLKSNEKCDRLIKDNDKLTLVISEKDQEIVKSRNFWYMQGILKGKNCCIQEIENLKDKNRKLIEDLSASAKKVSNLNGYTEKNNKEKEDKMITLSSNLSKANKENRRLQVQVDELRHNNSKNQQKNKNTINYLEKDMKNLEIEKSKLQNKVSNMSKIMSFGKENSIKPFDWRKGAADIDLISDFHMSKKMSFGKERCIKPIVWRKAANIDLISNFNDNEYDLINHPALFSGVHKWTICIQNYSSRVSLGVVTSDYKDRDYKIFERAGSWAIGSQGYPWHNGEFTKSGCAKFNKKGTIVSFILDLTSEGTLSYFVDYGPKQDIFTNMKSELGNSKKGKIGFIPAGRVWGGSVIRFHGFDNI